MGYDNFLIEDHYKVPLIAKLLHTLPHYNITFHRTNNTFKPTDEIYLEVKCGFFILIDLKSSNVLDNFFGYRVWAFWEVFLRPF